MLSARNFSQKILPASYETLLIPDLKQLNKLFKNNFIKVYKTFIYVICKTRAQFVFVFFFSFKHVAYRKVLLFKKCISKVKTLLKTNNLM